MTSGSFVDRRAHSDVDRVVHTRQAVEPAAEL
jgi:hypothetical protein